MRRPLALSAVMLLFAMLACNLPGGARSQENAFLTMAAETFTAAAQTAGVNQTSTVTATGLPAVVTPTNTQPGVSTATSTSTPCNVGTFVQDVTVPDNTVFQPNEAFTKTWRLRNAGSCTWTSGYSVVFDSGDIMGGPASQQLTNGSVAPGQTIDVSLNLKAPGSAGTYKGNWKLRESGGVVFGLTSGGPFFVQIKVQAADAPLPPWPLTKQGESGPVVRALQHLLKAHGEDLTADGVFGPITKTKLQHFQSENGLTADGIAGPLTWPKLIVAVKQGNNGQAVRAVQVLLSEKFGYAVAVDGIFGPQTDAAVRDYQDDHDLGVDGIVGPITWQSLVGE